MFAVTTELGTDPSFLAHLLDRASVSPTLTDGVNADVAVATLQGP